MMLLSPRRPARPRLRTARIRQGRMTRIVYTTDGSGPFGRRTRSTVRRRRAAMKASHGRILTSHAGSLPRPDDLVEANRIRESGGAFDAERWQQQLRSAVPDVVRRQRDLGIDTPGERGDGKALGHPLDLHT